MTVQLTLPYPPSANRLWVRARKGMRMSDHYRVWINEAIWTIKAQRPGKVDGPYKLAIHAQRPDKRARDIDNLIKPISDALECAGVVRNDSDCEMVTARWVTTGGPGIMVLVNRAAVEDFL